MIEIIRGYYQWIKFKFNKSYRKKMQTIADKRIRICESCEYFTNTRQCSICECYMDIKTKGDFRLNNQGKTINGCADNKW